jgi:hypothetical protein
MPRALVLLALLGCGHHERATADGSMQGPDATQSTIDATQPPDALPIDGVASASGVDCFYNWAQLGNCPAPVITGAFLTRDCDATTGIFVVGYGFESANQFDVHNGWLPHGPRALPSQLSRDSWNVLTPTFMCITTSADPSIWTGFAMQVKNPDGQLSNSVTVTNMLAGRPPLPSTDSTDPFDPDACLEDGMTQNQALALFATGASTATIGNAQIYTRDRACNAATGCTTWNAITGGGATAVGLAITGGGTNVDLTFGATDYGRLGANDYTLSYNDCSGYVVHVAQHCLRVSSTVRTPIAADGSYTQTDSAAILRF